MIKALAIGLVFLVADVSHGQTDTVKISSIHFKGNETFSEGTLLSLISLKQSTWFTSNYFNLNDLREDLKLIKTFYNRNGYPDIRIDGYNLSYNTDSSEVDVLINLSEGSPTVISNISFVGNRFYRQEDLYNNMSLNVGEIYEVVKIFRSRNNIKKMYFNAGYLDCTVTVDSVYSQIKHSARLLYKIFEGSRYKIGKIKIEGLIDVSPSIVMRELEFKENEFVNMDLITRTQRNLYRTTLFNSVIISPLASDDSDSTKKDILIKLREADLGLLDIAVGYGTLDKFRISSEVTYRNFLGAGYHASLKGKLSSLESGIQPSVTDPRIFGLPWSLDIFGQFAQRNEPAFRYRYWKAGLNFYRDFLERSKFILSGSYEEGYLHDLKFQLFGQELADSSLTPEFIEILNQIFNSMKVTVQKTSVKISFLHDLRDNLFDPSKGFYLKLSTEYITGIGDVEILGVKLRSTNNILKSEAALKYFYSPENSTVIASSVIIGLINNFLKDQEIFLLDDLFYAGGPNSIRGLGYELAGPLSKTGAPIGGKLKFVWNVIEFRQHILWIIGAVAFLDAGNVWANPDDLKLKDIRYSPGLGLRINTPIGLARVDYGFNPWPKPGESNGQLWFGIGYSF